MKLKHSFKTALNGLKMHRSRAALTILGIVIGIIAIILVMSLGKGAQNLILGQLQTIGPKIIAVVPGREPKGPTDFISILSNSLKQRDLEALSKKSNLPHLSKIMPVVFGSETLAYGNETYRSTIFGVTDLFAEIYDLYPSQGRIFNEEEIKNFAPVVVIGSKVQDELFGLEDPLDKKIKIKNKTFKVIGVLPQKGQSTFLNFDDVVIAPYTVVQQYILGIKHFNRIAIEVDKEENVERTVNDIKLTLRNLHGITDPEKDDFFIQTQEQAMETVKSITSILTLFLVAIAAVSLLVGGIGIMNIMLVSVTERTREIGLRKALGATDQDILIQFLFEAIILTASGGFFGIIFGGLLSFAASLILGKVTALNWVFTFPLDAAILGLTISALVGLIFGLYPARKAALKSPVEALRYE